MNVLRLAIGVLAAALCILLAPSATAAQGPDADKLITNSIGMKLTLIPAGRFLMGSPDDEAERDPEEVQHEVAITKPFYMGVFEVTQGQYRAIDPKHNAHFNAKNGGGADHPVEQVRWKEAVEFCAKLSDLAAERKAGRAYRLPTEAEWEYACRARSKTAFNVGDTLSAAQANFNGNFPYGKAAKGPHHQKTTKVGSYAPNAFGLHDMHGNVMEWCADWYDPEYYKKSPKEDPSGPAVGVVPTGFAKDFFHVVRGGSWLDEGRGCRSAYRFRLQSTEPYRLVGFRVVCVIAGK
jgi:formylglycine-generating enzyme required for sulfatase activity